MPYVNHLRFPKNKEYSKIMWLFEYSLFFNSFCGIQESIFINSIMLIVVISMHDCFLTSRIRISSETQTTLHKSENCCFSVHIYFLFQPLINVLFVFLYDIPRLIYNDFSKVVYLGKSSWFASDFLAWYSLKHKIKPPVSVR